MTNLRELIVVISSPGDVGKERAALPSVIQRLNKNTAGPSGLILSVRRWEDAPRGFWNKGVQHHLDSHLKIEKADIFIGILWKRFGTPGKDCKTGTQHEFDKAYKARKINKKPKILLYFNQKPYSSTTSEQAKQYAAVLQFKEKIQKEQEGLHGTYRTLQEFRDNVYDDIHSYISVDLKSKIKKRLSNGIQEKKIYEPDNRAIERYLDNHSRKIAKIISENWTKESGLFACCGYENGKKYLNQPSEPDVTKSELAKQHLKSGYQHDVWEFYQVGKKESVKKCEEICGIINAYEQTILAEIEKEIRTSSGNQKLERKNRGDVFKRGLYPLTFDFRSLYLYPDILSAIFNEAHSRNNGTAIQKVRIRENSDYKYLVIGNLESLPAYMGGKEQELAFGDHEMMSQLQVRVEKLLENHIIRDLVKDYYVKMSELGVNSNISKYEEGRKGIWRSVNNEAKRLKGQCDECSDDYIHTRF